MRRKMERTVGDKIFVSIIYVLMGLMALICLYPMWHVVMASFSDPIGLMRHSGVILKPIGHSVEGYKVVLQNPEYSEELSEYDSLRFSGHDDQHGADDARLCAFEKRLYV